MELNKYDLVEWVADLISKSGDEICEHCMFNKSDTPCVECHNKTN